MPGEPISAGPVMKAPSLFTRCYVGCRRYFWYGVALVVVAVGTNAYQYYLYQKQLTTIASQEHELNSRDRKIDSLQGDLESAQGDVAAKSMQREFAAALGKYLATKFDDLDRILLKSDADSVDFVNWMVDNAVFYGNDMQNEASYRYGNWKASHAATADEYLRLKDDIDEKLSQPAAPEPDQSAPPQTGT